MVLRALTGYCPLTRFFSRLGLRSNYELTRHQAGQADGHRAY